MRHGTLSRFQNVEMKNLVRKQEINILQLVKYTKTLQRPLLIHFTKRYTKKPFRIEKRPSLRWHFWPFRLWWRPPPSDRCRQSCEPPRSVLWSSPDPWERPGSWIRWHKSPPRACRSRNPRRVSRPRALLKPGNWSRSGFRNGDYVCFIPGLMGWSSPAMLKPASVILDLNLVVFWAIRSTRELSCSNISNTCR